MKAIKRRISLLLAGLMLAGAVSTMPVKAEEAQMPPKPTFHEVTGPVVNGNASSLFVETPGYEGKVQYQVHFRDSEGNWTRTEYTEAVDASVPYRIDINGKFTTGENAVSVWVKRADVANEDTANPRLEEYNSGYDNYNFKYLRAIEEGKTVGAIDYELNGTELTIKGIEGVDEGTKYTVYLKDVVTGVWTTLEEEWINEEKTFTVKPGKYYLDLNVDIPNYGKEAKWDAWRLTRIDVTEQAGEKVAFSTVVEDKTYFGLITVNSESSAVAKYKVVYNGQESKDFIAIDSAAKVFPTPKAGDAITIKFFDASGVLVKAVDTKVGDEDSFMVEKQEAKEYEVEITVTDKTYFGIVQPTVNDEAVASYKVVFNGTESKELVDINNAAKVFPTPKAGEKVTIKLFDANGALLGEVEKEVK